MYLFVPVLSLFDEAQSDNGVISSRKPHFYYFEECILSLMSTIYVCWSHIDMQHGPKTLISQTVSTTF